MSEIIKNINESNWGDSNGKRWEDYETIKCPDGQVIDMVKLIDDQFRAKTALVHLSPVFSAFVGKLRWIYTFRVKTQATDGYNLFINPQFTYNLSLTEKCFVMAHEIMHCLLSHMRRGKGHDPKLSNIAADYEVNISLTDDLGLFKYDTVKNLGALIDKKYLGWGYEKIYADHPSGASTGDMDNSDQSKQAEKNQQQNQQQGQGQGQGQSGSGGNGDSQPKSDEYKKGWKQAMEDYKKGKLKF
jgi:predicted metal-dependent peptidase